MYEHERLRSWQILQVAGAVVNVTLWPSDAGRSDFIAQCAQFIWKESNSDRSPAALFLNQSNNLDPDTTLYAIFFGIKCVL
jgi:hypothetical protein